MVTQAKHYAITFSAYLSISDGLMNLAWLTGKAACSLDGH